MSKIVVARSHIARVHRSTILLLLHYVSEVAKIGLKMAITASSIPKHNPPFPSSHRSDFQSQFCPISVTLPASTTLSLLALISSPHEARALNKDQIVSSLKEVEKTFDQVQETGSIFFYVAQQVIDYPRTILKLGIAAVCEAGWRKGYEGCFSNHF